MAGGLPDLPVIRTLGGCGGTLLSRLFSALPGVVLLSETNPRSANLFGGHLNPLKQLRRWRPELLEHLAEFDEAEIGYPPRFGEMLARVHAALERHGRRLVVRDFSYADFVGVPFIWPIAADSSLDAAISGRFTARSLFLVRHPADQLASLRGHRPIRNVLSAERFVAGSQAFLASRLGAPMFRYEQLTAAPETTFRAMCEALDIPFAAEALTGFVKVSSVTGNLGRAADPHIASVPRSAGAIEAQAELAGTTGYPALLAALGYSA
jgi:hypothetical protein